MVAPESRPIDAAAEAARYALLRRLAPSMRHHLVVPLQPIGMVYEIMERRLRAPVPNFAEIQEGAQKINTYARAALASCVDVITWLAPDEQARTTARSGLSEILLLLQTGFTFRGYALRDELGEVPGDVSRGAFRSSVTGALVFLSDEAAAPAQFTIRGQAASHALVLSMSVERGTGEPGFASAPTYRPLTWADLQALAGAEGVQLEREGAGLRISLPWLPASA